MTDGQTYRQTDRETDGRRTKWSLSGALLRWRLLPPLKKQQPTNKLKIRILSKTSIIYLIRHASVILIAVIHCKDQYRWFGDFRLILWCKFVQSRPTIGRSSGDPSPVVLPMTTPLKIGRSVEETFNMDDKKVVGRPNNQSKLVPTSAIAGRCQPIIPISAHRRSV